MEIKTRANNDPFSKCSPSKHAVFYVLLVTQWCLCRSCPSSVMVLSSKFFCPQADGRVLHFRQGSFGFSSDSIAFCWQRSITACRCSKQIGREKGFVLDIAWPEPLRCSCRKGCDKPQNCSHSLNKISTLALFSTTPTSSVPLVWVYFYIHNVNEADLAPYVFFDAISADLVACSLSHRHVLLFLI